MFVVLEDSSPREFIVRNPTDHLLFFEELEGLKENLILCGVELW